MYKKSELHVQEFGSGREKRFVIYADYEKIEGFGPRWDTVVHPDIICFSVYITFQVT